MDTKILPCRPGKIENAEVKHDADFLIGFMAERQGVCEGCSRWKDVPDAEKTKKFILMNTQRTRVTSCD